MYLDETDQEAAAYVEEQRMVGGPNDETLEILMCALDKDNAAKMFNKDTGMSHVSGRAYLVILSENQLINVC